MFLEVCAKSSEVSILSTPKGVAVLAQLVIIQGSSAWPTLKGPTWFAPPSPGHRHRGYLGLHLGRLHRGVNMPRITLFLGVCAKSSEDSILSTSWGLTNVAHWLVVLGGPRPSPCVGADLVSTPLSRTPSTGSHA